MTLTVRSASVTGATTAARALTHAEMDENWNHVANFTQSGTAPLSRSTQEKGRDIVSTADFCDGGGTVDDTTQFNNARNAALGKTLYITGTPLISSALTISTKEHWVFDGPTGDSAANTPDSYLIKKSTLNGDFVVITAKATVIEGGGLVGQVGNGGDGYSIRANGVILQNPYVTLMGNDGIRIGTDAAGTNANSFKIYNPVCVANVRHGIYANDDNTAASTDANAGLLLSPVCLSNSGDGIKFDRANINTIVNPLCESNTGTGLLFAGNSIRNVVIGGDVEANTAANIVLNSGATNNQIYGTDSTTAITDNGTATIIFGRLVNKVSIGLALGNVAQSGATTLDWYQESTFTPTLAFGGGSTGMTYGTQYGRYTRIGDVVIAYITIILTAKGSSTGIAQIGALPFTAANVAFNSGASISQATNMSGLTGALTAQVATNTTTVNIYQYGATGTAAITHAEFTDTSNIQLTAVYPV